MTQRAFSWWCVTFVLGSVFAPPGAFATPARMWFSLSETEPYRFSALAPPSTSPQTAQLDLTVDETATVYLWAQPQTEDVTLGYNTLNNPFRQLLQLSLDIDASGPAAQATGAILANPAGQRYDRVTDSAPGNQSVVNLNNTSITLPHSTPAGLLGVSGFTYDADDDSGIGLSCGGGCVTTSVGPAWLLGTVSLSAIAQGDTEFRLQIGQAGIVHTDELTVTDVNSDPVFQFHTKLIFGADDGVVYDALSNRQTTLLNDSPDLVVRVAEPLVGDFSGDGRVDAADYTVWRDSLGATGSGLNADANRDRIVNQLDYEFWKTGYGSSSQVEVLAGDFNGDGLVDAADYTVWRDTQGVTGSGLAADANRDGVVNQLDYSLWKTNYESSLHESSHSIPESNTTCLVGIVAILMLLRSQRHVTRWISTAHGLTIAVNFLLCDPVATTAQQIATYIGPAGGQYSSPANWDIGIVPLNTTNEQYHAVINFTGNVDFGSGVSGEVAAFTFGGPSSAISVGSNSSLTSIGPAYVNGAVFAIGGAFFADDPLSTLGDGARFYVDNGVIRVSADTYRHTWSPSFPTDIFFARGGSTLDLSSLRSVQMISGGGERKVVANNSTIDLSNVSELASGYGTQVSLRWEGGGNILLNSLQRLNPEGANLVSLYYEAARNFTLPAQTAYGTEFHLPQFTSLYLPNLLSISGPSQRSRIDLQAGASWNATNDGFTRISNTDINLVSGASLYAPHVNALTNVRLTLAAGSSFATEAITDIDNSHIATSGNFKFDRVRDVSYINSRSLTHQNGEIFSARGSSTLDLSSLQSVEISAEGQYSYIVANNGTVDLSSVASLSLTGTTLNLKWEAGGNIDLSSLQNITLPISPTVGSQARFFYEAGRSFFLPLQTALNTELYLPTNTSLDLPNLLSLRGPWQSSRIDLQAGATINMPSVKLIEATDINIVGLGSVANIAGTIDNARYTVVANGGRLNVGGDLILRQTDENAVSMASGTLQLSGEALQRLEVGGTDFGVSSAATNNSGNFGIGRLVVGKIDRPSTVQLSDLVDNGNRGAAGVLREALYLYGADGRAGLELLSESTLVLNGINTYAWDPLANTQVHLNSLFAPGVLSVPYSNGRLQLFASAGPFAWGATGGGNWYDAANWNPHFIPDGDVKVTFGSGIASPATITVNADVQVGQIDFNNASHSYTIASDGVHRATLVGSGEIRTVAGSHTIQGALDGTVGVTKTGSGLLSLTGVNRYSGVTDIREGTLRANAPTSFGDSEQIDVQGGAVLDVSGATVFQLGENRTLSGGGSVRANVLSVPESSTVGGTLQVSGNVANAGRVAPGNSPGILTIIGNYSQQPTGVLEMEVGGTTPGAEHDMLIVTGTASLSGLLETPIINGYVPQVGDEMQLVLASNVVGDFDSHAAPNLANVNPNVAIDVETGPSGVRLKFVAPSTNNGFDGVAATTNWSDINNWITGTVPTTLDVITVENQSNVNQTLDVEELMALPNSQNAFTHELTVMGDAQTMAVTVQTGSSLSATVGVNVGDRGMIELGGGTVVTSSVEIQGGGKVMGSGGVVGDVIVGAAAAQGATLSAGMNAPGMEVGLIEVSGNYRQNAGGILAVDILGDNSGGNHDVMTITGDMALGGTLLIDASQLANADLTIGESYTLAEVGGDITGAFDQVRVQGRNDVYFQIDDETAPAGLAAATLTGPQPRLTGSFWEKGNVTRTGGGVNDQDAMVFATVLTYGHDVDSVPCGDDCLASVDFLSALNFVDTDPNGLQRIDFFDVPYFNMAFARSQGISLSEAYVRFNAAMITAQALGAVPEPGSAALAGLAMVMLTNARKRPRREP